MGSSKTMWMVRAGEGAFIIDEFLSKGVIAIGWRAIGDISNIPTPDELKKLVKQKYPEDSAGELGMSAGQIIRFRFIFKQGDNVITYDPKERLYHIGEISGDYEYRKVEIEGYYHQRKVKWINKISRDILSIPTRNAMGSIATIFEIREDAQAEIFNSLNKRQEPFESPEKAEKEYDKYREETINKAHEFIKDKISGLSWEEVQDLVAGLLRGMGYRTIISPKGPDRGKDIQASPDGLGLQEPKIIVEVKHRGSQMDAKEVRSFVGVLRGGNKGLFVSTGGFTKDARHEAERSEKPVTLIDFDMLVNLILQYYDNFDVDTRELLPLVKIFWPA